MKKLMFLLLLVLIPIILMSNVINYKELCNSLHFKNIKFLDRSWRLNQYLGESYFEGVWSMESKSVYVYNSTYPTRVDTLKMYFYDSENDDWILGMKANNTYDATGQYLTEMMYVLSVMGMDIPMYRMSAQYNAQHRVTMWILENYDSSNLDWTLSSWYKFFYNTNSINSTAGYYVATEDEPASWELSTITNDGQGRPIIMLNQTSADSTVWVNTERSDISYHPNDTSTGEDFIASITDLFSMYNQTGMSFIYGSAMVSEETNQYYDGDWINETRNIYTYDTQNKLIEVVEMSWDTIWVNSYQTLLSYDANGNSQQSVESMWNGTSWDNEYRYTYTWGQTTANDDNTAPAVEALSISASPNPFNGNVALKVNSKTSQPAKLTVYNTKGQLIRTISAPANSNVFWDGRDLNNQTVGNGIYFIKADTQGGNKTVKVLKLK